MTFLRELVSIRSGLENPSRPLTDSSLLDVLGGVPSETGLTMSPESSLRVGAALRGVQIIAGTVAGMPFKAYHRKDRKEFYGSVLDQKMGQMYTRFELWETAVAHMILHGNAYLFQVKDSKGNVTDLIPIHPNRVAIQLMRTNSIENRYKIFTIDGRGPFTNYDVIHIPMMSIDGVTGLGPIGYARETVALAAANEQAAGKLFGQGMMARGILSTDQSLDEEKASRLKTQWRQKMGGLDNAQDVAIMDNGAKFQALTLDPADAQFLESRKFQVTEIARLLGMPGWMLNDQEKSTSWGTGMEQQFTTWVKITLAATYLNRIEQRVSAALWPSGETYSEFNLEGLLRGDSKARAAFYNAGITGGWLTPNDVRPKENMPLVPWGDEPYLPNNQSAESQAGLAASQEDNNVD